MRHRALFLLVALALILGASPARAQPATVIGPVTVGNVPAFNSPTVLKDSGVPAAGLPVGPGGSRTRLTAATNPTYYIRTDPATVTSFTPGATTTVSATGIVGTLNAIANVSFVAFNNSGGALPTGITAGTAYPVLTVAPDGNSFVANVNTSTAGTGTSTAQTCSDNFPGTAPTTPFCRIQRAIDVIAGTLDLNFQCPLVSVAKGVYNENVVERSVVGRLSNNHCTAITFGRTGTAADVVVQGAPALYSGDEMAGEWQWFDLNAVATSGPAVLADSLGSLIYLAGVTLTNGGITVIDNSQVQIDGTSGRAAAFTGSISGTTLTVTAVTTACSPQPCGALLIGGTISFPGVVANTVITAGPALGVGNGTGGPGTYTVNNSQTAGSQAMTMTSPSACTFAGTAAPTQLTADTGATIWFGGLNTPGAFNCTVTGTQTVNPFATVSNRGLIVSGNPGVNFPLGGGASVTGPRYVVFNGGVMSLGGRDPGTVFPGTTVPQNTTVANSFIGTAYGGWAPNANLSLRSTANGAPSGDFIDFWTQGIQQAVMLNGIISSAMGYQIGGTSVAGHYLRGNGAVYVDGAIAGGDLPNPTSFIGRQVITSTQTYTATAGTNLVDVTCVGGGGGGGGAAATGAGTIAIASSGGGGGATKKRITSAFSGVTVTIGAAGAAGAAGLNNGGGGGTTTFGALLSAVGGSGGIGGGAAGVGGLIQGVGGGTASGGDINITGQNSGAAFYYVLSLAQSSLGGSPGFGLGLGASSIGTNSSTVGQPATGFGAGGGGAANITNQAAVAGSVGTPGICIVNEYR